MNRRTANARRLVRIFWLPVGTIFCGCTLLVSTDDLSGGSGPATTDSGLGDADATRGDAEADAVADADALKPDGDSDANGGAGDGGFHSCADLSPAPKFCDDFERSTAFAPPWDSQVKANGVTLVTETPADWPSRALRVTIPGGDAGTPQACLYKAFAVVDQISLQFDWKLTNSLSHEATLIHLFVQNPAVAEGKNVQLRLVNGSDFGSAVFYESDTRVSPSGYHPHTLTRDLVYGQWEQVRVHLQLAPTPHIKIQLGNDVVLDDPLLAPNIVKSRVDACTGIFYTVLPGDTQTMQVDNVIVDYP